MLPWITAKLPQYIFFRKLVDMGSWSSAACQERDHLDVHGVRQPVLQELKDFGWLRPGSLPKECSAAARPLYETEAITSRIEWSYSPHNKDMFDPQREH
jgi:hypothetical protein